jgi:hypothetical protein
MFLEELTPLVKELTQQPAAFLGGFVSGILRLKLSDDPLKSWLEQQGTSYPDSSSDNGNGPQSISIE